MSLPRNYYRRTRNSIKNDYIIVGVSEMPTHLRFSIEIDHRTIFAKHSDTPKSTNSVQRAAKNPLSFLVVYAVLFSIIIYLVCASGYQVFNKKGLNSIKMIK